MRLGTYRVFIIPALVIVGLASYGVAVALKSPEYLTTALILVTIGVGSAELLQETIASLRRGQFILDYIALSAIILGIVTREFFVAGIIVLMLSGGTTLEHYATLRAKRSLSALKSRLPNHVLKLNQDGSEMTIALDQAQVGDRIRVRTGEVIPLDGNLVDLSASIDESSLTGEPYTVEKRQGSILKSGTVNVGNAFIFSVTTVDQDSTYRKILKLVEAAEYEKSPLIRLANQYSTIFTIATLVIALGGLALSGSLDRVLAVLVLATPCPLILATPIALLGGVNAAARRQVVVKHVESLEALSRAQVLVFDKTGTLTLGKPVLTEITILKARYPKRDLLAMARALEQNSLHPVAQVLVEAANKEGVHLLSASEVEEVPGTGISGVVLGKSITLTGAAAERGMAVAFKEEGEPLAIFHLRDALKADTQTVLGELRQLGFSLTMCTGDSQLVAEEIAQELGGGIEVQARCSPEDKKNDIARFKEDKKIVVMIGDGINDAPALALADVGIVFSHAEQTAASEAADVVFLGGNLQALLDIIRIAKRTIMVAKRGIAVGIGLSLVGMIFAMLGYIPPVVGALLQEVIDIAVIIYALKASK
jgi:heavy metal translocating P-type ATPase